MTHRDATRVGAFTTELSVAVELTDSPTGEPPIGDPEVRVTNADYDVTRTQSGYYVLVDLPAHPATVDLRVEADAYLTAERSVTHGSLPADDPLVDIDLVPGPAYPFGGGETLVRGVVEDGDDPVAGADVEYVQGSAYTQTNDVGDYALAITEVPSDDVGTDDEGNRALKPGGTNPTIRVTLPDGRTTDATPTVRLGGTASADVGF